MKIVTLSGPRASGKTTYAMAAAAAQVSDGGQVVYISEFAGICADLFAGRHSSTSRVAFASRRPDRLPRVCPDLLIFDTWTPADADIEALMRPQHVLRIVDTP